jgi:uncharacterized protein (DUF1501 family)
MRHGNCGYHRLPSRRGFLFQAASAAGAGLLAAHADAEVTSAAASPRNSANACIFINLSGAPSHLDTFDPKDGPWNPEGLDLRQYGNIVLSRTLFPELSRITGDLCIVRSVQSWEAEHTRGQFYLQTGHPSNPAFAAETPHIGAVISREKGGKGPLPPFLAFNSTGIQGAAFLGGKVAPLMPAANRNGLSTLEHNYFGNTSRQRFEDRFALLEALDEPLRKGTGDAAMAAYAEFYGSARAMMYNPGIADVFRFSAGDEARYGSTNLGRELIVARNAVRASNGAVFLTTRQSGWDTHQNMFDRGYTPNLYQLTRDLDRAVGALVEDLKASGHFQRTLIVLMGEFGRTPGMLNARGGRDHHKWAMSAALLGGGVRGGRAIGETDTEGDRIVTPGWAQNRPVFMEDIACTIYSALGVDWTRAIADTPSGRKFEYVPYGSQGRYVPVDEVFA